MDDIKPFDNGNTRANDTESSVSLNNWVGSNPESSENRIVPFPRRESRTAEPYRLSAEIPLSREHEGEGTFPVHLMDYWRIVLKHRWAVLTALCSIVLVAEGVVAAVLPPLS